MHRQTPSDLVCHTLPGTNRCYTLGNADMSMLLVVAGAVIGLLFGMNQYGTVTVRLYCYYCVICPFFEAIGEF